MILGLNETELNKVVGCRCVCCNSRTFVTIDTWPKNIAYDEVTCKIFCCLENNADNWKLTIGNAETCDGTEESCNGCKKFANEHSNDF